MQTAAPVTVGPLPRERYGIVCLNHPRYCRFAHGQLEEILAYPVDALFCDMMWWNGVCVCKSCATRFRREAGTEIPRTIDWVDPVWRQFQACRQDWLTEWSDELTALCRRLRPENDCYHNFALGLANWTRGTSIALTRTAAFLGGDFYGPPQQQLLMTRFMQQASGHQPAEYMTTLTTGLTEHTSLRPAAELRRKALAAAHADQAFLAILAIDPDGRIDPDAVELCRQAFEAMRRRDPVEDLSPFSVAARPTIRTIARWQVRPPSCSARMFLSLSSPGFSWIVSAIGRSYCCAMRRPCPRPNSTSCGPMSRKAVSCIAVPQVGSRPIVAGLSATGWAWKLAMNHMTARPI